MRQIKLAFCIFTLVTVLTVTAQSQTVSTGTPRFGSFTGGPDVINLGNLNAHYAIPVFSKPGRGIPFSYALAYDSSVWTPVGLSGSQTWMPVGNSNWGWVGETQVLTGYVSYRTRTLSCSDNAYPRPHTYHYTLYTFVAYNDSQGISHAINGDVYSVPAQCTDETSFDSTTVSTTDGSGYSVDITDAPSAVVHARSGALINTPVQIAAASGSVTDSNGNVTSTSGNGVFTDTLNTTALTVVGSGTPSSPMSYAYTDTTGTLRSVVVSYVAYTVQTNFGCSGVAEYGPTSVNLVDKITFADNTFYQFSYEGTPSHAGSVTGRLAQVTLPTGGIISYSYFNGNNGIVCSDGSTAAMHRTTSDGDTVYGRGGSPTGGWTSSITPPSGNQTFVNFQVGSDKNFYETTRTNYAGSQTGGVIASSSTTCYNGATTCDSAITLPISRVTVYPKLDNGLTSKIDTTLNSNGLPSEVDEYDFGSGAPPSTPLRKTLTAYNTGLGSIMDHPSSVTVEDASNNIKAQTTFSYDQTSLSATGAPQHVGISGSRGNVTTITRLLSGGTNPSTTLAYDDAGNVVSATDPGGHTTSFAFSSTYASAYLTQTTMPNTGVAHVVSSAYDINTGLKTSDTDQNANQTTYAYDFMLRPTTTTLPADSNGNHPSATLSYPSVTTIQQSQIIDTSHNAVSKTFLDAYGRTSQAQLCEDGTSSCSSPIKTDVTYDNMGRLHSVSNPYRATSDPTYGITTTLYDALGRVYQVNKPDGSHTAAGYTGNATTTCDEASHCRTVYSDGLGRLTQVGEQNPAGSGSSYATYYSYDLLNNLLTVNQQGDGTGTARNRSFTYDTLSRMTQAVTPEAGTVNYSYNIDSVLTSKTDARNVTTNYNPTGSTIDALHRVTGITYSDGTPSVNYIYDSASNWGVTSANPIGRLTLEDTANTWNIYSYDALGRVTAQWSTKYPANTGSNYTTTTYNLANEVTSLTYPSGRVLNYSYDTAARLNDANSTLSGSTYHYYNVPSGGFLPTGTAGTVNLGSGVQENYSLNVRLQPCHYVVWQPPSTLILDRRQLYGNETGAGSCSSTVAGNNGNIMQLWDANAGRILTLGYDYLNRITSASTAATTGPDAWSQTFTYDAWGNMNQHGSLQFLPSYDANNRINDATHYTYDASGNLTYANDGVTSHSFVFDAENRVANIDSSATTYLYDGNGKRVRKTTGSNYTEYVFFGGAAIAEKDQSGNWTDYVLAGGKRVAMATGTTASGTTYYHSDYLGSNRLMTDSTGTYVSGTDRTYLPFGSEWNYSAAATHYKFTGDEHDSESNTEHTDFRQMSGTQGRWLSPDPYDGSMDIGDPQSLNRYAYVGNDPVDGADSTGLYRDGPCADPDFGPAHPLGCGWGGWLISGLGFVFGGGGGGGGGTASAPPSTPPPPPGTQPVHFPNETNGLPNGFHFPSLTWCQTAGICPIGDEECDFGPCGFLGSSSVTRRTHRKQYRWIPDWQLWGTHWCGPGGAGTILNDVDQACFIHDTCYDRAGVTADDYRNNRLTPTQRTAVLNCNQELCNSLSNTIPSPGSPLQWVDRTLVWVTFRFKGPATCH